jgi:hypothetical protein
MATVPPPDTIPETPSQPDQAPGEFTPPTPDTDFPDPGDPNQPEGHPS